MTRMVGNFAASLGTTLFFQLFSLPAGAQGAGQMEAVMTSNLNIPQTAWMKGDILGNTPVEQKLRETVDLMLRQRGYLSEKFSSYAVRI